MSVISFIEHYQRSIKKSEDDENRLLHCLEKLANLQVKVSDLQATGIGRTVNSLRKKPGKVGETVKSLVAKWMEIVESHMTEDEEALDHSGDEGHSKENGHSENSVERRMFSPEPSNKPVNGQDCKEKESSLKSHHSSRKYAKDDENRDSKSKHKHSDDKRKHDSKHLSSDNRHESSKSHHKGSRDNKDSKEKHSLSSKRHREEKSTKKVKKELEDSETDYFSSKKPKISISEPTPKIKEERVSPETINIKKEKHRDSSPKIKKERASPEISNIKREKEEKVKIKKESRSPERKVKIKKERNSPEPKVKREKSETKPSTSKQSSQSKIKKEVKHEKPSEDSDDELNGNCGTSFADALGNLDYTPTKKNKEKKKKQSSKPSSNFKPLPRSEELASMLDQPALTYRPLPHVPVRSVKPTVSDVDEWSALRGNKNQRTKVYSGMKAFIGEVPTLQDMCIKILQENIDALEHVGSVPFFLLAPVFARASAHQLARLEHYNQQFVDDFDDLWKSLVSSEFKSATPQEYECWRDVYERSLGERDHKMAQLAAKIKANNEARKAPQRTTKLAFEHSLVKPPRSVRKQQEKNGTARGSIPIRQTTSADYNEAGPSGLSSRDRENTLARTVGLLREGPSTAIKGKKRPAPLMQKTLKFMKTNFRR